MSDCRKVGIFQTNMAEGSHIENCSSAISRCLIVQLTRTYKAELGLHAETSFMNYN